MKPCASVYPPFAYNIGVGSVLSTGTAPTRKRKSSLLASLHLVNLGQRAPPPYLDIFCSQPMGSDQLVSLPLSQPLQSHLPNSLTGLSLTRSHPGRFGRSLSRNWLVSAGVFFQNVQIQSLFLNGPVQQCSKSISQSVSACNSQVVG